VPAKEFGARGPKFRLITGSAVEQGRTTLPAADHLIGMSWLYTVQAWSSLGRGKLWQAEQMLSAARNELLALACRRHGSTEPGGVSVDQLPAPLLATFQDCLVRTVTRAEVARAFRQLIEQLIREAESADTALGRRLASPLRELAGCAD
jgi:hypothetical protein